MTREEFFSQVEALKKVNKEELLNFVAQYIARNSPNRRKLSIQVYGGQHLAEFKAAKFEAPQVKPNATSDGLLISPKLDATEGEDGAVLDSKSVPRTGANRIDNIYTFKRSQELHESLRGGKHKAYA